jgi:hypothetical protein
MFEGCELVCGNEEELLCMGLEIVGDDFGEIF